MASEEPTTPPAPRLSVLPPGLDALARAWQDYVCWWGAAGGKPPVEVCSPNGAKAYRERKRALKRALDEMLRRSAAELNALVCGGESRTGETPQG